MEILIIRSTNIEHLDLVLNRVRSSFPDPKISILTHTHAMGWMRDVSIIPYGEKGDFSIFKIMKFRRLRFDLLILPFNNRTGAGYTNVIIFAFGIRAEMRMTCNKDGELKVIGYGYLLKRLIRAFFASIFGAIGMMVCALPASLILTLYGVRDDGGRKGV